MKPTQEDWALFWCGLLQPVIFGEIAGKAVNRHLRDLTRRERVFPDGKRRRPTLSTLKRKLKKYRQGKMQALSRKPRADRAKPRKVTQEMIDRAVALKRDQPRRSDETINRFLEAEFARTIPRSTLYRYLKAAGATRLKLGIVKKKVRRRWTRDHTHDLWLGDFEEGPYVLFEGEPVMTHLSAFIDCHSRYLVEGRYYYRQNLDILIDSLLRAWATHGASSEIYLDNAKVYHSKGLQTACYALGIRLIYRKPGDPSPGGAIERFFETAQSQFEAEVHAGGILTLEKLNRAFSAWLSVSYHERVHSETKQTPKDRYEKGLTVIRGVDTNEIMQYFMDREQRTVDPDFSDISLHGRFYRVDPKLRGDRVEVRSDRFSDNSSVLIYSLDGKYLGTGALHQREKGALAPPAATGTKARYNYLDLLERQHEAKLKAAVSGIDYRAAIGRSRPWPFTAFLKKFGRLLGRKGMSDFIAEELEALKKAYNRCGCLDEAMLLRAFEIPDEKTIPSVIYHLYRINKPEEGESCSPVISR